MQRKNPFKFTEENFKKWLYLYAGKYKENQILKELEIFFNMDVEDENGLIKSHLSYVRQLYFSKYNLPIPLWKKKELWRDFIYGNYININSIYKTITRRIRSIDGRVQHPLRKNPMIYNADNLRRWLILNLPKNSNRNINKDISEFFKINITDINNYWWILSPYIRLFNSINTLPISFKRKLKFWNYYSKSFDRVDYMLKIYTFYKNQHLQWIEVLENNYERLD